VTDTVQPDADLRVEPSTDAGRARGSGAGRRPARRRLLAGGGVALAAALLAGWGLRPRPSAAPQPEVCRVAPALPYDPASGLPPRAPRPVPADARCPVCGMFPARNLRWAAQVIYADGAVHYFDSPLTLHQFLQDVERYSLGRRRDDIVARWVTDHETGEWVDGERAFHVLGSDALGPMRAGNLPAFATEASAQRFARAHGGRTVPAAAIDHAVLSAIDPGGLPSHAH